VKYLISIFRKLYSTRFVASCKVEESLNTSFGELKDAVARARNHLLAGNDDLITVGLSYSSEAGYAPIFG
jgi:hypothetical protein